MTVNMVVPTLGRRLGNVGQAELEHNIVAIKDLTGIAGIGEISHWIKIGI